MTEAARLGEPDRAERLHGGMTREERDDARRRRLLDAGLQVFGAEGYATSTMSEICRIARVTERNYYDHFASREDLLVAVYDEIIADVTAELVHVLSTERDDPAEQIDAGLRTFVETIANDERRLRINFVEIVGVSARVEAHRRDVMVGFQQLVAAQISQYRQRGQKQADDQLRITTSALTGAIQESLVDWVNRDDRPPLESIIAELSRIFSLALLDPSARG
jgi:AcrR family transcriptional regulator